MKKPGANNTSSFIHNILGILPRISISFRFLGLLVFSVLLSSIVISFVIINISRDSIRKEVFTHNLSHAELTAEYASNYVLSVQHHLEAFASRPDVLSEISRGTTENLQGFLNYIVNAIQPVEAAGTYDTSGIQLLASTPGAPTVGQSFADREWFQECMASGQPYLSPPVASRLTGNVVMPYAIPVSEEDGEVLAVITGGINLGRLSDTIIKISYGYDARISLLDTRHGGVILTHSDPERVMMAPTGKNEAVNRLLSGESGSMEVTDSSGSKVLAGYAQVPGLPWGVVVLTPAKNAFASIERLTVNALLSAGAIAIFTVLLGFISTSSVTRPLNRLVKGTRIIGSGNLDYPIATKSKDEVGDVSREIAYMAQNLKQILVSRDTLLEEIKNREQTEIALKTSLERFHQVAENANEFIWEVDASGLYTYASPAVENITGYKPEEIIGRFHYYDFFTAETYENTKKDAESIFSSRDRFTSYTNSVLHKDGREVIVETSGQPVLDKKGRLLGYRGLDLDVTERINNFNELVNSQQFLSSLYDALEDVIFTVDIPERTIVYVNNTVEKVFGYTVEECIGKSTQFLYAAEDEYKKFGNRLEQAIQNKESLIVQVSKLKNSQNEIIMGEISTTFLLKDGKPYRVISVVRDITEKLKIEKEKETLRRKAEISSRLATVGEMAAGIAHEINNPLTSVIGFADLLLEEDLPAETREQLKIIAEGSNRVKGIIKRLLTFARQVTPQKVMLDIHDLLDGTLELRTYVLNTSNIKVVKKYARKIPRVYADASQLQQIFMNFIVNAEQAMKKFRNRGELTITTGCDEEFVYISFKDNGPGMSEEVISRIYDPFFTTKDPGEGTGLGIPLANAIVLDHGGSINIESEPGKGSRFTVRLPLPKMSEQSQASQKTTSIQPYLTDKPGLKVLVVDDEPSIRVLLSKSLGKAGHIVTEALSATSGLKLILDNSYDVILVDIRMPEMSGIEFFHQATAKRPELANKIIYITGDTSDANTRNFLQENALPYLTKPFDTKTLLKVIQNKVE
ncbi:MAG: PAS domain S-box protein [Dehalococcoidales bacterium]|nr:PAS domain S-box protein [Dehalococcoidales bacterium]